MRTSPQAVLVARGGGRPWTPEYLAFVLPLTPMQVLREERPGYGATLESRLEWTWINLAQRLTWSYGQGEALRRLNGTSA